MITTDSVVVCVFVVCVLGRHRRCVQQGPRAGEQDGTYTAAAAAAAAAAACTAFFDIFMRFIFYVPHVVE